MRAGISATYAASGASYKNAGVSRYVRRLVESLAELPGSDLYEVFTTKTFEPPESWRTPRLTIHAVAPDSRIRRALWDMRPPTRGFDVWFSTGHTAPLSARVPRLAMVHDLIPLRHPEYWSRNQAAFLRSQATRSSQKAELVVTNSEASKRDMIELLGVDPNRIRVAPLGPGNAIVPMRPEDVEDAVLARLGVPQGPFLFALSTLEPRKNLERLVEALASVRAGVPGLKLVVGGAKGWKEGPVFDRIRELGLEDAVIFLGYVPDEALAGLFAKCTAFVFPSLMEGFGMPVLEAMLAGAPILTSQGGAMEEVAGPAAAGTFDAYSAESIAESIRLFLHSSKPRGEVVAAGFERAKMFTWRRCAEITRSAMLELVP